MKKRLREKIPDKLGWIIVGVLIIILIGILIYNLLNDRVLFSPALTYEVESMRYAITTTYLGATGMSFGSYAFVEIPTSNLDYSKSYYIWIRQAADNPNSGSLRGFYLYKGDHSTHLTDRMIPSKNREWQWVKFKKRSAFGSTYTFKKSDFGTLNKIILKADGATWWGKDYADKIVITDDLNFNPNPDCKDEIDNDKDGKIDLFDTGCESAEDSSEYSDNDILRRWDNTKGSLRYPEYFVEGINPWVGGCIRVKQNGIWFTKCDSCFDSRTVIEWYEYQFFPHVTVFRCDSCITGANGAYGIGFCGEVIIANAI